jgi:TPR repeat protein
MLMRALITMLAVLASSSSSQEISTLVKRADQLYEVREYREALPIYRQAAQAGDAHAMTRVGYCYDMGYGVTVDYAQAVNWYRKAAAAGDLEGMAYLGGEYAAGNGVPKDMQQALYWFHKSADAGGAAGMNKLGLLYQHGDGVPRDPAQAMRWYEKAAALGDMYAMNNIGILYVGNWGIPQNYPEAFRWFRKAAELGETDAMNILAVGYEMGVPGLSKDPKQAEFWYRKSAALGNQNAKQALMRLGGWQNFDLNGDWEAYFTSPMLPEAIRIVQKNNTINAVRLSLDFSPMGIPFLRGTYDPDKQASHVEGAEVGLFGLVQALNSPNSSTGAAAAANWVPVTLTVLDRDHFSIENKPAFQRITAPRLNDVPCSPQNPLRVKPQWAYVRGKMAADAGDYNLAACWYHVGIAFGDVRSRSGMGDLARKGLVTTKNANWAFTWYEQAASGGDAYAARSIAEMYDDGELPMEAAKSQFWHAKAAEMEQKRAQQIAAEQKKEASDRAALHLIRGIALVGGQLLTWDVGASPECDTRRQDRSGSPIANTEDPERAARRDRLLATGEIYCGKPIDISPLLPENLQ